MSGHKVLNLTESDLSYYSDHIIVLFYNNSELLTKWYIVSRMISGIIFASVHDPTCDHEIKVYKDHKVEATYNGPYEIPDIIEYILSLECDRDYGLRRYSRSL
jgi:hypothetical protein